MSRLGFLILACCLWTSVAELKISNHNETDPENGLPYTADIKYSHPTKVIFTSAMLFTFLVSVIGNSLVIYVITKHRSMRTSTNCLIMNLAVCDLLITVLQTPSFLKHLYTGDTWFEGTAGKVICKLFYFGMFLLFSCSVFNFIAIAIDRFLAVTRPLTYKLSSKWVVKIGIPAMWLTSALSSINTLLEMTINDDETPKCVKSGVSSQDYISASSIVISFVVLIVLYSIIAYRLWKRNIPGEASNNQNALAIRTARKVTVLMISVVTVFFVSWAPAFVVVLSYMFDAESIINIVIYIKYPFLNAICYWLIMNSCACNPCLYFIFIESFRQSLKTACLRCRATRLGLCRIGQERGFATAKPIGNRRTLNILIQEERAIELTAYSTVSLRVAPL
ncbi:substance-K receptor-like [Oculina patagonica]